jgi:hypothetical protein
VFTTDPRAPKIDRCLRKQPPRVEVALRYSSWFQNLGQIAQGFIEAIGQCGNAV